MMRTPIRLLAMPRRTPLRGSLCRAKKIFSAVPSASGSRSSPPTTTPVASGSRAICWSSAAPLFEMRAAASWDAPILRPTTRLALWPLFARLNVGFGVESRRFQNGAALAAGSCSIGASAATAGPRLRPSESSFFQKGVPFTLGSRSGFGAFAPRESDSSFFQNGVFVTGCSSGGSSAAGTGGWTTGTTAVSGTGGSSAPASPAPAGSGSGTGVRPAPGSARISLGARRTTTGRAYRAGARAPRRGQHGRVEGLARVGMNLGRGEPTGDFEARSLEQADQLVGTARARERLVDVDDAAHREIGERLLHRLHPARSVRLHDRVDLLDLRLANQV